MSSKSWFGKRLSRSTQAVRTRAERKSRLAFDTLEGRDVPATIDVFSVASAGHSSSNLATDNDFTRFQAAFSGVAPADHVVIHGTLDWSQANAKSSWDASGGGNFGFSLPHVNGVTVESAAAGNGITGPGDIAIDPFTSSDISGEGPFYFDGTGSNQGWTIQNLTLSGFDTAIFYSPNITGHEYDGTQIKNNTITVASDGSDAGSNAGILIGPGSGQTIQGNTINITGGGTVNDASSGISSFTYRTAVWNNLLIDNNTVNVTTNSLESIIGIAENSGSIGANITVSNNTFSSVAAGNNPMTNHQVAFGITSESVSATVAHPAATVTYSGNHITGAQIGFEWALPQQSPAPYDFTLAEFSNVFFTNNDLHNVKEVAFAQNGGKGMFTGTTATGVGAAFHADGAGTVITVADPTSNFTGFAALKNEVAGGMVILTSASAGVGNVSQNEGNLGTSLMVFTISLSSAPSAGQYFTVNYATANGTADGNDYIQQQGILTFLPGELSKTISIMINGDTIVEADETFTVNLTSPTLFTNGVGAPGAVSPSTATGTIVNDDITAIAASIGSVTKAEGNTGSTPYTDFVFAATLNTAPAAGQFYTVNFATGTTGVGAGFADGNDFLAQQGVLTFLAGSTTPTVPVTIKIFGDTNAEPSETFKVTLSNPQLHVSTTQVIPGNIGGTGTGTGTITNDDSNTVSLAIANVSQAEGNTQAPTNLMTFPVTLTGTATNNVFVNWTTSFSGSANGNDFQAKSGVLTFLPGSATPVSPIQVRIYGDTILEPNETFTVVLSNPTTVGGIVTLSTGTGTGTITNDD